MLEIAFQAPVFFKQFSAIFADFGNNFIFKYVHGISFSLFIKASGVIRRGVLNPAPLLQSFVLRPEGSV
jgi:hypothetical protein